jgi:hypothetical protein
MLFLAASCKAVSCQSGMEQMPATTSKAPVALKNWMVQIGFAAIVLAHFIWFVGPGLSGRFDVGDPWNIH